MHKMYTLIKKVLEQSLLYVTSVGEHFAVKFLCEHGPYAIVSVVYVCPCETKRYNFTAIVAEKV